MGLYASIKKKCETFQTDDGPFSAEIALILVALLLFALILADCLLIKSYSQNKR